MAFMSGQVALDLFALQWGAIIATVFVLAFKAGQS
jgi:hypothetical protein